MQQIVLCAIVGFLISTSSYGQSTQTMSSNYSPLHWAAAQGYIEMIRVLVDKGYDINAQDIDGFTPLHYAAATGSFSGVEYLINNGADVYVVNNKNLTPLTIAAKAGEQKIVDYLFIKMRSTRIGQLQEQTEKERVNTDLVLAAKSRSEAERLRQQASEWTKEAEYWRTEAEKWTREANTLKDKQIQIDLLARERYDEILTEKLSAEKNYKTERLARNAAERLLREQGASTKAQIRAYEAQSAALAAQRSTDAAIDNLAEEFLRQGMMNNPQKLKELSSSMNPALNIVPVDVLNTKQNPTDNFSITLDAVPPTIGAPTTYEAPLTEEAVTEEVPVTEEIVTEEVPVTEEIVTEEVPVTEEIVTEEATEEYAEDESYDENY